MSNTEQFQILTETIEDGLSLLVEESLGSKKYYIKGVYFVSEAINQNKRIYPKAIVEPAISAYIAEQVSQNRAVGELGHPASGLKINLDRISHRILELSWNGDVVEGNSMILDTPMGLIAKGLLNGGMKLGISSRAGGLVTKMNSGALRVTGGLKIGAFDIVQNPSAPGAFLESLMEDIEPFYNENEFVDNIAREFKKRVARMPTKEIENRKINLFEEFISRISKID